jgi:hypothetical protein
MLDPAFCQRERRRMDFFDVALRDNLANVPLGDAAVRHDCAAAAASTESTQALNRIGFMRFSYIPSPTLYNPGNSTGKRPCDLTLPVSTAASASMLGGLKP